MKPQDIINVWKACRPYTGFSKTKISRLTSLDASVVDEILLYLLDNDYVEMKWRGFQGWVAAGTLSSLVSLLSELDQ